MSSTIGKRNVGGRERRVLQKPTARAAITEATQRGGAVSFKVLQERLREIQEGGADQLLRTGSVLINTDISPEDAEANRAEMVAALENVYVLDSVIGTYSYKEMRDESSVMITKIAPTLDPEHALYDPYNTIYDTRMGGRTNEQCSTCSRVRCGGHFGLIPLNVAVLNPVLAPYYVNTMSCVCDSCSGLLVPKKFTNEVDQLMKTLPGITAQDRRVPWVLMDYATRRKVWVAYLRSIRVMALKGDARLQYLAELIRKGETVCMRGDTPRGADYCTSHHYRPFKYTDWHYSPTCIPTPKVRRKPTQDTGLLTVGKKDSESTMTPAQMYTLLTCIDKEDAVVLGYSAETLSKPKNLMVRGILVTPPQMRPVPATDAEGRIVLDDFSKFYNHVLRINEDIHTVQEAEVHNVSGVYKDLYTLYRSFVFGKTKAGTGKDDSIPIRELIAGKGGIFRRVLQGKRTDYCGRSILGGDPSLRFGQLRIPEALAPILTKRVDVTAYNIKALHKLLQDGMVTHITRNNVRMRAVPGNDLQIGDVVDRSRQDGDRVIFNRQPTLSSRSFQVFEVVLGKQLTIGLHHSILRPYNADFDGDEGNLHVIHDTEAEQEAIEIMGAKKCPLASGGPVAGLILDAVTGSYKLTDPAVRVSPDVFSEAAAMLTNTESLYSLPVRLRRYKIPELSGQAYFSMVLPETLNYEKDGVVIKQGILVSGRIRKAHVSGGRKSIMAQIWEEYGPQRLRLSNRYSMDHYTLA